MPAIIIWIIRLILTIISFIAGLHLYSMQNKSKPCINSPKVSSMTSRVSLNCNHTNTLQLCTQDYSNHLTYLHKQDGDIPTTLFPELHHPASPAKSSIILTSNSNWKPTDSYSESGWLENCDMIYLTRTGQRMNQPNKCVSVMRIPDGLESVTQISHRFGETARKVDQYMEDYSRIHSYQEEKVLLAPLLKKLDSLKHDFLAMMGSPLLPNAEEDTASESSTTSTSSSSTTTTTTTMNKRRTVTVMVANDGVMDLLLNYLCSTESAHIDRNNIMVFVGQSESVALVESMGVHAMYSPALGSMPKTAAGVYMDETFGRMMWFKITAVYIAMISGFNVLFQDVDLVWLRDPVPYLEALDADISFMDDGARTPRYTPFFVNSGFYYMKYTSRVMRFMEIMLKSGVQEISQSHSHQSTLVHHIAETVHLTGLKIYVLDVLEFPSGQAYHDNKPFIQKLINHEVKPYVFHMCWTDNRENKLKYFKEINLWYLPEQTSFSSDTVVKLTTNQMCSNHKYMMNLIGKNVRELCCQRHLYWNDSNNTATTTSASASTSTSTTVR